MTSGRTGDTEEFTFLGVDVHLLQPRDQFYGQNTFQTNTSLVIQRRGIIYSYCLERKII
jgi:hypothetical protein